MAQKHHQSVYSLVPECQRLTPECEEWLVQTLERRKVLVRRTPGKTQAVKELLDKLFNKDDQKCFVFSE